MSNAIPSFARQPILDSNEQVFGYEFFYRDAQGSSHFEDARSATATVLANLTSRTGLTSSAADAILFINVDIGTLQSDILLTLPPERFVFELPAHTVVTTQVRELIGMLHKKGYRFAIDNATTSSAFLDEFTAVLPMIDYVKFNTMQTDMDLLPQMLNAFSGKKLVAQRVEIPEVFEAYRALGFDYFQGYFFAKLSLHHQNSLAPKHLGVVRIYNLLLSNTPMETLAREFERHNELTLQLLQYVHSTKMVNDAPNRSVRSVLEAVGTERLERWLLLLIYSKSSKSIGTEKSPWSLMAEQRIDIMYAVIEAINPLEKEHLKEQARLCALISLMEPVLNVPLATILEQIQVEEAISDALLARTGTLGFMLALSVSIEAEDFAFAQVIMRALKLNAELLPSLQALRKL